MINFNTNKCNISNTDSSFRLILSIVIAIFSVYSSCYILLFISMMLGYTSVKKYCFLYDLLKINEKFSLKNYYMSHLPKYNPSSVFMFNKKGEISFQNESSKEIFKNIKNFKDLSDSNINDLIINESSTTQYYNIDKTNFQLNIKGVNEINSILVYVTDISEVISLNKEIEITQKEIIYTMGEIGETRSKETGNHVKRVAQYSYELAKLYGLSEEESTKLKLASPMHDIGKIGIPDNILNKPGKLDIQEWKVMQTHAQLGYEMLKNSTRPIIQAAAIVAYEHHEKFDGSGYPLGLKGEQIHIYGRITAVADVFDALGSKRVYKDAWELEKILELFETEKGKHFDPEIIDIFKNNLDIFLKIRDKYKDIK